ncbi:MAG TPA: hypothetical protein VHM27_03970 [Rhizomicrobium sp.]|nr:hypothetical protein [Rhizomicrobium sp.]
MKRLLAALVLFATPALAQTGSNIGLTQYPAPKCDKPQPVDAALQPKPPPENPSESQASIYNSRLRAYNAAIRDYNGRIEAFNACIQAYLANGNADARRIREALDAAVALANAK